MNTTITMQIMPDSLSEHDLRAVFREARRRGQSPSEFVAAAVRKSLASDSSPSVTTRKPMKPRKVPAPRAQGSGRAGRKTARKEGRP